MTQSVSVKPKPFLKWAGGKQKVIPQLDQLLPEELKEGKIHTHREPFVGSGAMLFHMLQHYQIEKAIISDTNAELITVYQQVQKNVEELIAKLQELQNLYFSKS